MKIKSAKYISVFLINLLLVPFFLAGCYDSAEVDDEVYPIVVGIDKGINNKQRITIQYPTYKDSGGGGGGAQKKQRGGGSSPSDENEQEGAIVHSIEAPTFTEGLEMFNMAVSRRISLLYIKLLVVSEDFAKDGILNILSGFQRLRQARSTMNVMVVKGKAEDYVKQNKVTIGGTLAKSVELMQSQSQNTSYFPQINFYQLYRTVISPYGQAYTPYGGLNNFEAYKNEQGNGKLNVNQGFTPGELVRQGVAKREDAGTAIFNGDKFIGALNSNETRYFLMVRGLFKEGNISIVDPENKNAALVVDLRESRRPRIKASIKNGKPQISIELNIEGDAQIIQSRYDYETIKNINKFNDVVKNFITDNVRKVIDKTQKEFKSDIFSFGEYMAHNFINIRQFEKYNWCKHYPEANISLKVNVNIRRTGLVDYSSEITASKNK